MAQEILGIKRPKISENIRPFSFYSVYNFGYEKRVLFNKPNLEIESQ